MGGPLLLLFLLLFSSLLCVHLFANNLIELKYFITCQTNFLFDSQANLCSCMSLVRGQSVPMHGSLVTLVHAFAIFVGESH
jgi:hypothetical protein